MQRNITIFSFILLLTVLVYLPALQAGFVWDDAEYVFENPLLRSLSGLWWIWSTTATPQYYPLVFTTFWLEYQLWELQPMGYHAVNIVLHAMTAFMVGLILRRLHMPGAWWVAILFALHPVNVESVAWVTERKNVLSGLFYCASILSFLRFVHEEQKRFYALALFCFGLALFSKTAICTLPVTLGLILYYQQGRLTWKDGIRLIPFFLLGLGLALVTIWVESTKVGAQGAEFDLLWGQRFWVASKALLFYLQKTLFPYPLIFNYPRWDLEWDSWLALWPIGVVLIVFSTMIFLWLRGHRYLVFPLLFFGITLSPALGFFNIYYFRFSFVADHFLYLAAVGILILYVLAEQWCAQRIGLASRIYPWGFRCLVGLVLGGLTWQQTQIYETPEILWKDTLVKNPQSWLAHHNLGAEYIHQGRYEEAIPHFDRILEFGKDRHKAYLNRGNAYVELGQQERALRDYSQAIEHNPEYAASYFNRGNLFLKLQQHQLAIADYSRAIELDTNYAKAYQNRANAYFALEQYNNALRDFNRSLELYSLDAGWYYNRANAYYDLQQFEDAIADYNQTLKLSPQFFDALLNRGLAYASINRLDEALADFDQVIRLDPQHAGAHMSRGNVHYLQKQPGNACRDWKRACDLGECTQWHVAKAQCGSEE